MNKQCYSVLIILLIHFNLFSQKEANIWYFGENAGLDFSTNPPTALTDGQLNTTEGCSSFSDVNGNLLFYSDGISVYNKNHQLMTYTNGDLANNLEGNPSSTQSGMIIPKPGSSDIYYLFTIGTDFVPPNIIANPGFNYYEVDLSKNSGLGEITNGPINLAIDPLTNFDQSASWSEKVTAVKGKDCNTFWVLSFVNDTFYAYKVNEFGVDVNNVVLSPVNFSDSDKRGYLQVSPDGTKIAFADYNDVQNSFNGSLVLFDFDSETGLVNPTSSEVLINVGSQESPYGVAFSQQSNKLYTSVYDGGFNVYQFDLESTNIAQSKQLISSKTGFRGALQLGPDGKIYASIPDQQYLDVIENPNDDANNVTYSSNSIFLNGNFTTQGLPPFLASLLLPIEITDTTNNQIINNQDLQYCTGESIIIQPETISGTNITYEWVFNNGITSTTIANTSDLNLNNLTTLNNGTYELTVTLEDVCANKTTLEGTFTIGVFDPPTANQPTDINFCDTDGDGFNIFDFQNDITPIILGTQDPNQFDVLFFLSLTDAENNINTAALSNPYTNTTAFDSQDIYVRIHNSNAPDACYDLTQFNLTITAIPEPSQPQDYTVCDDNINGGDTDGFYNNFLLSSKDSEILGSLSSSDYNISYHSSLTGAQTDATTDLIDKNLPYRNTTINEQLIYVRIENSKNSGCYVVSEDSSTSFKPFKLIINPLPTVNNIVFIQCDTDFDASSIINLELTQENISTNYTNESFKYYTSESNAIADISEITNINSYAANNGDIVWVKTISTEECYRISQIEIDISFTGNINYTNEFKQCDDLLDIDGNNTSNNDDEDGITFFDISSVNTDVKNLFPVATQNDLEILIFESIDDRNILNNPITDLTNYRNQNIPAFTSQSLYIKVINKNNNGCEGLGEFTILTEAIPKFEIESPQILCLNTTPLVLEVTNNTNFNYSWIKNDNPSVILSNTYQVDAYEEGEYSITVFDTNTNYSCEYTQIVKVIASNSASIDINAITIIDDSNNNSITIDTTYLGEGDYEFALFNDTGIVRDYQTEPYFDNLEGDIYTISIKDTFNCGFPAEIQVSVIDFPDFFTPNNDGYNDTWSIQGVNATFYPNSTITIFDRYGKKIAEIPIDSNGWDGLYNGKILPSTDYWYSISLVDPTGNTRNKKGHFSLLRK